VSGRDRPEDPSTAASASLDTRICELCGVAPVCPDACVIYRVELARRHCRRAQSLCTLSRTDNHASAADACYLDGDCGRWGCNDLPFLFAAHLCVHVQQWVSTLLIHACHAAHCCVCTPRTRTPGVVCTVACLLALTTPPGVSEADVGQRTFTGGTGAVVLQQNTGVPTVPTATGAPTMLSWGSPNSFSSEIPRRTPVRSTDSLGDALPPLAIEQQPPGFWTRARGHAGGITPDTGGTLSFSAGVDPSSAPHTQRADQPLASGGEGGVGGGVGSGVDERPVGVHVVESDEGRVVYYPYIPASVGSLAAAVADATGEGGSGSQTSQEKYESGKEGMVGGYVDAPLGEGGTAAVVRQKHGSWVVPGGNYRSLSQAIR
jgi:hypothetical protein